MTRWLPALVAVAVFTALVVLGSMAPEHLAEPNLELGLKSWLQSPPLGTDTRGRPLLEYAMQGARVVVFPAFTAGIAVAIASVIGGLLRCVGTPEWTAPSLRLASLSVRCRVWSSSSWSRS